MRVLAQYPETSTNTLKFIITITMLCLAIVLDGAVFNCPHKKRSQCLISISFALIIAASVINFAIPSERESGHVLYDVAADGSISHEEIMAQYDVVENRGDLYIIRDLELE